jgi:4-hydroxybenzoate polyprenyltransferase|tara:strand:+ start:2608 stop:3273 length:666 start_codon:yes stop_codon:yes gene_type:complete
MIDAAAARIKSLLIATHFGPTVLVVSITFFLALSQFSVIRAMQVALAIFAGQLVVGWSNEVIDYPLDRSANRIKKPLVSGEISINLLEKLIPLALVSATLLSYFGPLGLLGTFLHLLGILSATLYNLKLKSTLLSPIPYLISFSGLPWAIYIAAGTTPPPWLYIALALFSTSFHFLNVLKDLQGDLDQKVLGLPQRLGKNGSIFVASFLAVTGILVVLFLR